MCIRRQTILTLLTLTAALAAACVEHVVGPAPEIPVAASYPSIASMYSEQPASASDSRVPAIATTGDSVVVGMVVPTICGRDTVMAGEAHDTIVVTLRRTLLPLPCAIALPDVRLRASAAARPFPRVVVVSIQQFSFTDTTRVLVMSSTVSRVTQ